MEKKVIENMLQAARQHKKQFDAKGFKSYSFEILTSAKASDNLFLRYKVADATNIDRIRVSFQFMCFDLMGKELDCNTVFKNKDIEVAFYDSLILVEMYDRV